MPDRERTDTERLDWLGKKMPPDWSHWVVEMDGSWLASVQACMGYSDDPEWFVGETLRAAIDAAMDAEED